MNLTTFHRRRAERFAQLLEEADDGRRNHARSRLAELVAIGHQTSALRPTVELDPEFRTGLRALLVATAERDGIGRTATEAAAEPVSDPVPAKRRPVAHSGRPSRIRARGAIIIGVAAGAIAVSGMSAASENAVPGDALYGVKRSTERAQLALASSDITRGQLYLDFARTRVAEAGAVRHDPAGFISVLDDMDRDTQQGIRLLTNSAVTHGDPAALDAINAFVSTQRMSLAALLDGEPKANRDRTLESLTLLDAVKHRADALRPALSCGKTPDAGSDRLGPKPTRCSAPALDQPVGSQTEPDQKTSEERTPTQRHTEDAGSDPTPQAVAPSPLIATQEPAEPLISQAPEAPAAPASEQPATGDGVLGEVGRILGDLLG